VPNFEFLPSTAAEIWRGSHNSQKWSRDPLVIPFYRNFHFLRQCTWQSICMPNFEFIASAVAEIWRGSHNSQKWSHDPLVTPFDPNFHFFTTVHLPINLHAKFRIYSFNHCWDMEGVPKFPKMVTWSPVDPFSPKYSFLRQGTWQSFCLPNFEFLASAVAEIWRGSHDTQNGHVTPWWRLFTEIFIFYDRASRDQSACQISNF